VLEKYNEKKNYCFDDIGVEPTGCHYTKECNVLGEILLSRYDLFVQKTQFLDYNNRPNYHQKMINNFNKTHITTNLNTEELEKRYGSRVRSRLRAMFNLISFDQNATDKRR